ncbi:MAG: anti-anti-sigma factor [Actinobacteria bacterium 13_2_20CM_2_71_6]|jgi:rsbT antagonist protein RsbS|nr:MAG: anti-anti-sigma factor [Actinobacteria bacterium 13_2_20CM_2_71_6]
MPDDVPIIRMGQNLLVTLQGNLEDTTVEQIERAVTREVARTRATGVLVDVNGLSMVDSFVARVIARLVAMVRLLGAQATIVGLQPAVAITLVELGVPMAHVRTALNAEQGMARLRGSHDELVD